MTDLLIVLGSALFVFAVIFAVRAQTVRRSVTAPSYATSACEQCNATIGPGEGIRAQGSMYCSDDCARWAW